MFYLLPACGSCCENKHAIENIPQNHKGWTKLEKTGIISDACLIACLCIMTGLALCVYFGLPMGPLNALSVLSIPYIAVMGGAAILLFISDVIKMICRCRQFSDLTTSERLSKEREKIEAAVDMEIPKENTTPIESKLTSPIGAELHNWTCASFKGDDLQNFEICPAIKDGITLMPDTNYLEISKSPYDHGAFGVPFEGHPLYFNASASAFRLTPMRSVFIVQGKDSKKYACEAARVIDLKNSKDLNHWEWVLTAKPQALSDPNIDPEILHNQLKPKFKLLNTWWSRKLSASVDGKVTYLPGLVKTLFPTFTGSATQEEFITVQADRNTGNFYLKTETNEALFFACSANATLGKKQNKTVNGLYGTFTVEVQEAKVDGATTWVIVSEPKPTKLNA